MHDADMIPAEPFAALIRRPTAVVLGDVRTGRFARGAALLAHD